MTRRATVSPLRAHLLHAGKPASPEDLVLKRSLELHALQDACPVEIRGSARKHLFKLVSSRGSFVLRMYRPPHLGEALLRSELLWMRSLCHEAGIGVPEPLATECGSLTSQISASRRPKLRALLRRLPGVDTAPEKTFPWLSALVRWVPGEHRMGADLRSSHMRSLGVHIASLHEHAERYVPPEGFVRPAWTWEWAFGESAPIWGGPMPSGADQGSLKAAASRIRDDLRSLDAKGSVFGIIHRDLTPRNTLFHEGKATTIDFDSCGWGYYLFDLAVALLPFEPYGDRYDPLKNALLEGYQAKRPLPEGYQDYLESLTAMKVAAQANRALRSLADKSASSPNARRLLRHSLDRLARFASSA